MASTSRVCSLRAITVGSLRTIPLPLAYTRVLAVPRSMARSLARAAASPGRCLPRRRGSRWCGQGAGRVGSEGFELSAEGPDVGVDRPRRPVAQPQHEEADPAEDGGDPEEDEGAHDAA